MCDSALAGAMPGARALKSNGGFVEGLLGLLAASDPAASHVLQYSIELDVTNQRTPSDPDRTGLKVDGVTGLACQIGPIGDDSFSATGSKSADAGLGAMQFSDLVSYEMGAPFMSSASFSLSLSETTQRVGFAPLFRDQRFSKGADSFDYALHAQGTDAIARSEILLGFWNGGADVESSPSTPEPSSILIWGPLALAAVVLRRRAA